MSGKPYDSSIERWLRRTFTRVERSVPAVDPSFPGRMAVLFFMLFYMAVLGLIAVIAGLVFNLERKAMVLILVLGFYIALPVGLFVFVVRNSLRNNGDQQGEISQEK